MSFNPYHRRGMGDWLTDLARQNVQQSASNNTAIIWRTQTALNSFPSAYPKLTVDGVLGPRTKERLIEFQRANRLSATGVIDTATLQKLANRSSAGTSVSPLPNSNGVNLFNPSGAPSPQPQGTSSTNWILYGAAALLVAVVVKSSL